MAKEGLFFAHPEAPFSVSILEGSDSSDSEDVNLSVSQVETALGSTQDRCLNHGIKFTAGLLEFTLTALPLNQLLLVRAFRAARNGELNQLKSIFEFSVTAGATLPPIVVTPAKHADRREHSTLSIMSEQGLDVNSKYQPPKYDDEPIFSYGRLSRQRSSIPIQVPGVPDSPLSPVSQKEETKVSHHLLLHIAIEKKDVEMVKFLLGKGADVSCTDVLIYVVCLWERRFWLLRMNRQTFVNTRRMTFLLSFVMHRN